MEPEDVQPEVQPQDAPQTEAPAPAPAEPDARVSAYEERLERMEQQNQELMWRLAQNQAQTTAPAPAVPEISEDDIARVINEGEDPKKIAAYVQQKIKEGVGTVEQSLNQMRSEGSQHIKALAMQAARNSPDMPHFKKYEKDIEKIIQSSNQSSPEGIKAAYDYVVGTKMNEILAEEKEKMLRQQTAPASLPTGSGKSGRNHEDPNEAYRPEKVLSSGNLSALDRKGINPDQFAERRGFKDFTDMAKATQDLKELERAQNETWLKGDDAGYQAFRAAKQEARKSA